MALESVRIPAIRCPNLERFNIVDYSLYQIFEEHYGIELARSEEEISAMVAQKIHRKTLDVALERGNSSRETPNVYDRRQAIRTG